MIFLPVFIAPFRSLLEGEPRRWPRPSYNQRAMKKSVNHPAGGGRASGWNPIDPLSDGPGGTALSLAGPSLSQDNIQFCYFSFE
jgi:hypothetical protein